MAVGKRGNRLVLDFNCYLPDGRKVRCVEREGLDDGKNRKRVQKKWQALRYHIDQNTFDYLKFFPHGSKEKYFATKKDNKTFNDWWHEWLQGQAIRRTTEENYGYIYNNHLGPYFGERNLASITEQEILIFRKRQLEKGYNPATVNHHIKMLCMPLKAAFKQDLIDSHPGEDIKKLKELLPDIEPLTFQELSHLLEYLRKNDPEWYDIILFWTSTGLRPGEFYALRWERTDIFNGQVLIKETRPYYGGVAPVKTETSDRVINVRPNVVEALKRQQLRTGLMNKWVFMAPPNRETKSKNQWTPGKFREALKYRLRLAGLKVRPAKQLRHTFATLHIAAGESISWVSKTMGHAEVETTLKRYNRFIPNLTREDGSAFENTLNGNNLVTPNYKGLK